MHSPTCLTGHNCRSGSCGLRWAIPGIVMNDGACEGSWFFVRKPVSGNSLSNFWSGTSPLVKIHRCGATLSAWRNDLRLAEANANKNRVFSVRHFSPMPESVELTSGSSSANGGFSKANKTTWRTHSDIVRCSTGLAIWKLRSNKAICGSFARSYLQWRSTDALDVLCEIMVPGWKPLSNKSKH